MCVHSMCHAVVCGKVVAVALIVPNALPSGQHVLLTAITGSRYQMSFCYRPG